MRRVPTAVRPLAIRPRLAAVVASAALLLTSPARAQDPTAAATPAPKAAPGELVPEHAFRPFLAGSDGRQQLSQFRGQPVLIVNWTDTDFGLGAATQAKKLAEELVPQGLVSILMDSHNKQEDEILSSAMRLFPGSPSRFMRTDNLPIAYEKNGPPPVIALVGVDGTLLLAGSYTIDLSKAEKLIKAELKKRKSGWGEHEAARSARALAYGEQRLAAAREAVAAALATEPDAAELLQVRDEIDARVASWERAVQALTDEGRLVRALDEAHGLAAAVAGNPDWEARAASLLQAFETPEAASGLELDRKLLALLKPLDKRGPSAADVTKLRKLAESAGDTAVGKRAQRMADIAALASK